MSNLHIKLPIKNTSSKSLEVILEPLGECFFIQPDEAIEIHAIFDKETTNLNFSIEQDDKYLVVYAPGVIGGFVDCYAIKNGVRLIAH
jgi:hypothetical protein